MNGEGEMEPIGITQEERAEFDYLWMFKTGLATMAEAQCVAAGRYAKTYDALWERIFEKYGIDPSLREKLVYDRKTERVREITNDDPPMWGG
jgi:hypothetical protein